MTELIQIRGSHPPDERSFALFDQGLRPFFLGASLFASLSLPWWLLVYAGVATPSAGWPGHLQHAHEMVFGFGGAAVAGFLLTAAPNWTGTRHLEGAPLAALAGLWLLGRLLFQLPSVPPPLLAAIDTAFLPTLLLSLWPAFRGGKRKNLVFAAWLLVMALANLGCHLDMLGQTTGLLSAGLKTGVYSLAMLVAILGGRVVPTFTRNALRLRQRPHETETNPHVDLGAKAATLGAMSADVLLLDPRLVGGLAGVAAILLGLRMRRWRSLQVLDQPIVWILHVAHLWLVVAMGLLAAQHLGASIPPGSPLHALTTGVIGTMVLAIMSRASLGHTGRPLVVSKTVTAAYLLVIAGATLRTFGPIASLKSYQPIAIIAGTAWALGYLLFTWVYTPILLRPRVDGK